VEREARGDGGDPHGAAVPWGARRERGGGRAEPRQGEGDERDEGDGCEGLEQAHGGESAHAAPLEELVGDGREGERDEGGVTDGGAAFPAGEEAVEGDGDEGDEGSGGEADGDEHGHEAGAVGARREPEDGARDVREGGGDGARAPTRRERASASRVVTGM